MTSSDDIYAALTEILNDVFNRDDLKLTPELSAKDVKGWDSFKQIEIILGVEERYSIRLNTKEIDSLRSVGDLVAVIQKKIA